MKKVMLVFGTRPEAIKMSPLVHALKADPMIFEVKVCITAQHREMLDQVLEIFNITPDIDLDLMTKEQDLFDLTSSILLEMRRVLDENKPDIVLVHGDTTTALATSLACFYKNIDVGHIEAGLRTYDIYAPFPEEFNRQVVSKITKYHFAPSETSRENLLIDGVNKKNIIVTGNTVIDALKNTIKNIKNDSNHRGEINNLLRDTLPFNFETDLFLLITGHRRENFGRGFIEICQSIKKLSKKYPNYHFVYPVHLNPNVQQPVLEILNGIENVHLIAPLDYEPFVWLLFHCYLVLTDSGGIQEEAPSFGKPVLVMRDTTERPEAIEAGTVELVGTNQIRIIDAVSSLIENKFLYEKMSKASNPYGNGEASIIIKEFLKNL